MKNLDFNKVDAEYFRLFFSLSVDMFCIAGADGYFKYINPAWEKVLGYSLEELKSKPYLSFVHPEDTGKTVVCADASAGGEDVMSFENRYRCKDGTYKYFRWASRKHPTEDLIFAVARDMTDQKIHEQELHQSKLQAEHQKEYIYTLLSQVPAVAAILTGPNHIFEFANKNYRAMIGNRNPVGLPIQEAIPNLDPVILQALQTVYKTGEKVISQDQPVEGDWNGNGETSTKYFTYVLAPLRDSSQAVCGIWCLAFEVTEFKQMEGRLQMSEKMASLGTMAAGVAHEVNNPLAFVMITLELMAEQVRRLEDPAVSGKEEVLKKIKSCGRGLERIHQIVRSLKAFSRTDDSIASAIDVNSVIETTIPILQNEIKHRARLELNLGGIPKVFGNEGKLGQVMLNLILNAAQSIPVGRVEDNNITISSQTSAPGTVQITIADTGCGISQSSLRKIFEPFYTTKPIGEGTGLGLSICHGIVSSMNGKIGVESEVGKGSTFTVLLPIAEVEQSPKPLGNGSRPTEKKGDKRKILVLDDEVEFANALGNFLSRDYRVSIVHCVRDALVKIQNEDFDLILCDVMMPQETGLDFHAHLQRLNSPLQDRTLFMTGGMMDVELQKSLDRLKQKLIEKPFSMEEIRRVIEASLATQAKAA